MIHDLSVDNYRSFAKLRLPSLSRVNLIVGMNNSGKTSLLEAIFLLSSQGSLSCLSEILRSREERVNSDAVRRYDGSRAGSSRYAYTVFYMFHQDPIRSDAIRALDVSSTPEIRIRSEHQMITVRASKYETEIVQESLFPDHPPQSRIAPAFLALSYSANGGRIQSETQEPKIPMTADFVIPDYYYRPSIVDSPNRFIMTGHTSFPTLASLWDQVALTPREETVIEAVQIIEPRVERISFTSGTVGNSRILVKMSGQDSPIPLGTLGDGMRRILGLAINAVNAEGGVLLVDEVDTGLYYRVQTDMWRLLLGIARRQNVQIFATTHSLDCIQAFQRAVSLEGEGTDAGVIRLDAVNGSTKSTFYSPSELEIAVREEIEVR